MMFALNKQDNASVLLAYSVIYIFNYTSKKILKYPFLPFLLDVFHKINTLATACMLANQRILQNYADITHFIL